MSAVSLMRAGYEKKLRDAERYGIDFEATVTQMFPLRNQLLREREALRRILLGVTIGRRTICERHARSIRSRSAECRPQTRTLNGRVEQLREEIHSQRRLLTQLEEELRRRDEAIREMEAEDLASRERERLLVDRLQEAVELNEGGAETERILRAELDFAESRLAAFSPGRVQQREEAAAAFDVAANEGVLQRLQEMESLLAENEQREERQSALLEEMRGQISLVIEERDEAVNRVRKLENKYQKAKEDVTKCREIIERLSSTVDPHGRLVDGRSGLERARERHAAAEEAAAAAAERQRRMHGEQSELSQLLRLVEEERAIARSLHEDLDATRKMLLDRDTEVHALAAQLSEARIELSAAQTYAELERGRADEASAASLADTTAYADALDESEKQNSTLHLRLSESLKQCASYAAKLEAQGRDLISVKKELQRLQLQQ
ncbi:hypothetical protein PMAYCL1PPCAC_11277, partial [Pristionchus mayeri]